MSKHSTSLASIHSFEFFVREALRNRRGGYEKLAQGEALIKLPTSGFGTMGDPQCLARVEKYIAGNYSCTQQWGKHSQLIVWRETETDAGVNSAGN